MKNLDWENERYVRVWTRDSTEWQMWSWQAQALYCLLSRKVDRAGVLPLGRYGARGVCAHVKMPWSEVELALGELLDDEVAIIDGEFLKLPEFMTAQEAKQSDKARQRKSRELRRASSRNVTESHDQRDSVGESQNVTTATGINTEPEQPVTKRDQMSRLVTTGHTRSPQTEPSQTEPSQTRKSGAKKNAPAAGYGTFLDYFQQLFQAHNNGAKPSWGKRQGQWVNELLHAHGLNECKRRAEIMFSAPPVWPTSQDLATLRQHFDKYAVPGGSRPARRAASTGHSASDLLGLADGTPE